MSQAATHLAAGLGHTQAVSGQGCLGLLMLDTQFPRPAGDLGLAASYPVPVLRVVVHGAWPAKVVGSKAGLRKAALVEGFKRAVIQLQRQGAWAITTSCGFLVLLQKELQGVATVPVETSSLLQLPRLLCHFCSNSLGNAWSVYGVNGIKKTDSISRLVALQGTNQMEFQPGCG